MFQEILGEAYLILKLFAIVGFIELVLLGISRFTKRKQLFLLIASLVVLVLFTGLFFLDNYVFGTNFLPKVYMYLITISFLFVVLYFVLFIIKYRQNQFKEPVIKKKMIYTVHNKKEYIYCFAKYNEYIYLLDGVQTGIKYHLKKNEFCDEAIKKVTAHFGELDYFDLRRNGILTVKGEKEDDIYYCYMIELNHELDMKGFNKISIYDVNNLNLERIDKYIILKCLTDNDFTDTI